MKLFLLIPAYNANPTIEKLVDRVIQVPLDKEAIVVDDGSLDGTRNISLKLHEKYSDVLHCCFHKKNLSKGAAI